MNDKNGDSLSTSNVKPGENSASGKMKIETLQHYFGKRELSAFDNSEILRTRFLWQLESTSKAGRHKIVNKDTGAVIGVVPQMLLSHSWRMAHTKDAKKIIKRPIFELTHEEWDSDRKILEKYIRSKKNKDLFGESLSFFDVWELSEIDFEAAGLEHPQQFMALLKTAVFGEVEQNRRIVNEWHRIKRYPHKVELALGRGGIFSQSDVAKLSRLNVKFLNDIKKLDIFALKNLELDYDFEKIVKDINRAFREDLARRRDVRYKIYPFIVGFISLAAVIFLSYKHQYTLIKDDTNTGIIMALLTLCVVCATLVFIGGMRGKKRRFVRTNYVYYTRNVKKSIVCFALIGVFSVISVFVFYQRYDGYNSTVYYCDLDDGTIGVAGLRDDETTRVTVPSEIDGKTVTAIDSGAFSGDIIEYVSIPDTVTLIDNNAFKNCEELGSIKIPSSVTSIGKNAFKNSGLETITFEDDAKVTLMKAAFRECTNLKTVNNMGALISVGENAFLECKSLTDVTFSDKLETIENSAFEGCTELTAIYVPDSVVSIGKNAFRYCDNVQHLAIPFAGTTAEESLEQNIEKIFSFSDDASRSVHVEFTSAHPIGAEAFADIAWITSLSLGDKVTEVYPGAFANTPNLAVVKMSSAMTEIYESMFEGATSLTAITGMETITTIKDKAFANCKSLAEINLSSVTSIGASAFENCDALKAVNSLSSVTSIGDYAFLNCKQLSNIGQLNAVKNIGNFAFRNSLLDGDVYIGSDIEKIDAYSFAGSNIDSLTVASNVEGIGAFAFAGCENLKNVSFPSSLASIGDGAFYSCTALSSLDMGFTGLNSVGNGAFQACTNLSTVYLTSLLSNVPEAMFKGCERLTNVYNLSAKSIGDSAFEGCALSMSFTLNSGLTSIGKRAFASTSITYLNVPETVTSIGENAFADCAELVSVAIPFLGKDANDSGEGYVWVFGNSDPTAVELTAAKKIYTSTFKNSHITSLTIHEGVTAIEASAFKDLTTLSSISIPSTVKTIGNNAFENCTYLTTVTIPSAVTSIAKATFKNCTRLSNVNFGTMNVTSIGEEAFMGTAVGSVITFSEKLVTIEKNAFATCTDLDTVYLESAAKSVSVDAFGKDTKAELIISDETLYQKYLTLFKENKNIDVTLRR